MYGYGKLATVAAAALEREFEYRYLPLSYWDDKPIPNPARVFALMNDDTLIRLSLDENVKTYGDLDALVQLETLAGHLGQGTPVVLRPGANLIRRNLGRYNLEGLDLRGADLRRARLGISTLCNADLRGADLTDAGLSACHLEGADLRDAVVSRAFVNGPPFIDPTTDFTGAYYAEFLSDLPGGWDVDPATKRMMRR
jgi:hypothetical protein